MLRWLAVVLPVLMMTAAIQTALAVSVPEKPGVAVITYRRAK